MTTLLATPTSKPIGKEGNNHTRGPWRSNDLDLLPENGTHYEIINGELYMAKPPH